MAELVPPLTLTLDRARSFKMNFEVAAEAERELARIYGRPVSILQVMLNTERFGITEVAVLLWCGLRYFDETITLPETYALLTLENYGTVVTSIFEAWNQGSRAARPAQDTESSDPLVTVSPGSGSGVLPASPLA